MLDNFLKTSPSFSDQKTKDKTISDFIDVFCLSKEDEKYKFQIDSHILKIAEGDEKLLSFLSSHIDIYSDSSYITATSTKFNIEKLKKSQYSSIVNFKKINDVRYINKFFEAVNLSLPINGIYFGSVQTYPNRRKALLDKYPVVINRIIYLADFIFNRFFPKIPLTKKLYFYLTKGKGRVVSKAETYGRLYSCGFELLDEITVNKSLYFLAKKITEPAYDLSPTYGAIIKLKRIGFAGKLFNVYKLRTMHPYSEYLQEYIYKKNDLQKGGKIKNDFRVSPEGRILRKIWLDEIPMIYNIIRGDMKIVGVRPLSPHFFSLYDKKLQSMRIKNKPGLIPPFYADMPSSLEEIMKSEMKYLNAYEKNPIITDLKYFLMAMYNILIKRRRSN